MRLIATDWHQDGSNLPNLVPVSHMLLKCFEHLVSLLARWLKLHLIESKQTPSQKD